MGKIRFARFVINDIAANGMQQVECFTGPDYYVDPRREISGRFSNLAHEPKDKDSWSLWIDGWIFKSVVLQRGPDRFKIDVTKEELKEFVALEKAFIARRKENARKAKEEKEARRIAAQDWP